MKHINYWALFVTLISFQASAFELKINDGQLVPWEMESLGEFNKMEGAADLYRYKKWRLTVGESMYIATVVANYEFSNPFLVPFELSANCIQGLYTVSIRTSAKKVAENHRHLDSDIPKISAFAKFDNNSEIELIFSNDLEYIKFAQGDATTIDQIQNSSELDIKVVTKYLDGSGLIFRDTFELDGATKVLEPLTKECKPRN
ncbi:hypothetical protein RPW65_03835 [Pseudomonas sp. NyZ704]|nr:hypothetical protein RPW65_03835 [Pseudomonas sp. NyZ704]